VRNAIPGTVLAIGLVLMVVKIVADGEPGAIPLALVLAAVGWIIVDRVLTRSRRRRVR
jgi:hypothetical protein